MKINVIFRFQKAFPIEQCQYRKKWLVHKHFTRKTLWTRCSLHSAPHQEIIYNILWQHTHAEGCAIDFYCKLNLIVLTHLTFIVECIYSLDSISLLYHMANISI